MLVGLILGILVGVLIMVIADKIHQYMMLMKIDKLITEDAERKITYNYHNDYDVDMHIPRVD